MKYLRFTIGAVTGWLLMFAVMVFVRADLRWLDGLMTTWDAGDRASFLYFSLVSAFAGGYLLRWRK